MPRLKNISLILICTILLLQNHVLQVKGTVAACTVSVSPLAIVKSSSGRLYFTVNNTDSVTYAYVKISAPGSGFTVTDASASNWTAAHNSSSATFAPGTLASGANTQFYVDVSTGDAAVSAQTWTVVVSDDGGGASAFTCTGTPQVAVTDTAPDEVAPLISAITLSDLSTGTVKVNWTTDEAATSVVNYGTADTYGSTKSDGSYVTSHSVEITGLTANTTYHYQIQTKDASGNTGEFGDATFVTAKSGTTTTTTTTVTTTTTKTVTKIVEDTTAPNVSISTDLDKFYTEAPQIRGTATDNIGVGRVEYSIDDGKNWLAADISAIGAKSVNFNFTPEGLDDGTYKIKARVTDSSGNKTVSQAYNLTIDRLPPAVAVLTLTRGSEVFTPDDSGAFRILARLEYRVNISAVGGATQIELYAADKIIPLTQNPQSNLWSADFSLNDPGNIDIEAKSVDGAGNSTEQKLAPIKVLPNGRVLDIRSIPLKDAEVTLYVQDRETNDFRIWDGAAFGQDNSQNVNGNGEYLLLPQAGIYYLEVRAPGYYSRKSPIFILDKSQPLTADIKLKPFKQVRFGSVVINLPDWEIFLNTGINDFFKLNNETVLKTKQIAVIGKTLPVLELETSNGKISTLDLGGKPTIISLLATWLPTIGEQLIVENELADKSQVRVLPVLAGETLASTQVISKIAGFTNMQIVADRDGIFEKKLNLTSLPAHLLLDKKGVVRQIKFGVLDKKEILDIIY